jgi:hypothetical protein
MPIDQSPASTAAPSAGGGLNAYDLFNGDADGLCALHQLRLAEPRASFLISGVKRDIALFDRLPYGRPLEVTALDIPWDRNAHGVCRVLNGGGHVTYFDHRSAKSLFRHPQLSAHVDAGPGVCTSILVDRHLDGVFRQWTIVAAYGDNLDAVADRMAREQGCTAAKRGALAQLGYLLNYNAYGESHEDLHFCPVQLYRSMHRFESPFDFMAKAHEFRCLQEGHASDQQAMQGLAPYTANDRAAVYVLPDLPWARRLCGTLANQLVARNDGRSVAVLTPRSDGDFLVNLRIGSASASRADVFCSRYPAGGGRHGAGGIDRLPDHDMDRFINDFFTHLE